MQESRRAVSVISIDITSPDTVESLRRQLAASDLERIRLRHALREALDAIEAHDYYRGVCDDNVTTDESITRWKATVAP